jgi:hypothetical protein
MLTGLNWYQRRVDTALRTDTTITSKMNNGHSASQEIPRILRNPKVRYRVHKNLPLVSKLSQMTPVYSFLHYFPKTL